MRNRFINKALSGVLALTLAVGSLMGYSTAAHAYETDVSDGSISGTGSEQSAKGQWTTHTKEHTIYRVYPIIIPNPDTLTGDYQIPADSYFMFRDLALYATESPSDTNAYHFTSATKRGASPIANMTVSSDGSFDFSSVLGVSLDLPTHTFTTTSSRYISFSEELQSKIRTSGEDANIKEVFSNYINAIEQRYSSLSANGRAKFDMLKEMIAWGTQYFDDYCKNTGLVIEVCSEATNRKGGRFVFSWQDLMESKVGRDAYYIWKVFNMAENSGDLLNWSAVYEPTGVKLTSRYNGLATFLLMNVADNPSSSAFSQGISMTLTYDGEIKANMDSADGVSSDFGITTTAVSDKLKVKLGNSSYKNVLTDAFSNSADKYTVAGLVSAGKNFVSSLLGTKGSTKDSNKLGISGSSDSEYTLNAYGDKSSFGDSKLVGYDTIQIPISTDVMNMSDIYGITGEISSILSGIKAKTYTEAVQNGWGNSYSLKFYTNDTTTRQALANTISGKLRGAGTAGEYSSKMGGGTLDTLANLQGSTTLSGRIAGTFGDNGEVTNAKGTFYASIAYLAKATDVIGKEAEVTADGNKNIISSSGIQSKTYSVSSPITWGIDKKGYTYVIAWRASDYDLIDENALASAMLGSIGSDIKGESGAVLLRDAFKNVTGVSPLGSKYMGANDVTVGAVPNSDNSLSGIHVLVVKIGESYTSPSEGDDVVDSNELNFVYPNLLGNHANILSISPMADNVPDIKYDYTVTDSNVGDLWSFKGSKVHYYYPLQGLFGVSSQGTKSFGATSYPTYAYNISRALWGDSIVASNYRGESADNETVKSDITNNLGLTIGAVGSLTPVTCGDNVDATYNQYKKDDYTFTGTIEREWYTTETDSDGNSYQQKHNETVTQTNQYTLTHSLNKYKCLPLGVAINLQTGKSPYSVQDKKDIRNKVTLVTESNKTVGVYPEIPYKYFQAQVSGGILEKVKPMIVYCMGERVRNMKPSSVRGISMKYNFGYSAAVGSCTSDGAAVSTDAKKIADKTDTIVIPNGANIDASAEHTVDYELISYSLDVVDKYNGVSVREAFDSANSLYKPMDEHMEYVNSFMDQVNVDVFMRLDGSVSKAYVWEGISKSPELVNGTEVVEFPLIFEYGLIDHETKDAVIKDMATTYDITYEDATVLFNNSGFEHQLQDMFESANDVNNKSKNRWYDEQSVTLVIRKYVTAVDLGDILINDKIDYGTIGQNSYGNRVNDYLLGSFYITVRLPEQFMVDGKTIDLTNKNLLLEEQKIDGADFAVWSKSTNDWGN